MSSVGFSVTREKDEYNTIDKKGKIESEINMKRKRRVIMLLCIMIVASNLTGCSSILGKIPSEEDVMEYMTAEVETENYELVDSETIAGLPRKKIYYFESTDRDLKFTATSTLDKAWMLAGYSKIFYSKKIKSDYIDAVHALYKDDVINKLCEIEQYEKKNRAIVFESEAQFENIAEKIYEADQIYSAERKYNDQHWMNVNNITGIRLYYKIDDKVYSGNVIILNGNRTKKDILDEIYEKYEYAQKTRTERSNN